MPTDFVAQKGTYIEKSGWAELRVGEHRVSFGGVRSGRLDVHLLMSVSSSNSQVHFGLLFSGGTNEIKPSCSCCCWGRMLVHVMPAKGGFSELRFHFMDSFDSAEEELARVISGKVFRFYLGQVREPLLERLAELANDEIELPFDVSGSGCRTVNCIQFCRRLLDCMDLEMPVGGMYSAVKAERGTAAAEQMLGKLRGQLAALS